MYARRRFASPVREVSEKVRSEEPVLKVSLSLTGAEFDYGEFCSMVKKRRCDWVLWLMVTKQSLSILPRRLVFLTEPPADIGDICYTLIQEDAQVALAVNNQPGILADAILKKRWHILWITVSNLPCLIQCAWLSPRRGCSLPACQEPSGGTGTQAPLLQQIFEKVVPVQRVEIFVDSG